MKCKCEDWKINIKILEQALINNNIHGGKGLEKPFTYCPYCGEELIEETKK